MHVWRGLPCLLAALLAALAAPSQAQVEGSRGRALQTEDTGAGFVPSGRMCEEGGYCSVGHSKFWTGDIQNSAALREMLESVSYKKEIILTSLSSDDEQTVWLDPILQLHWDLERAGYAHLVVHTSSVKTCQSLHVFRNVSCIWDATPTLKGHSDDRFGIWYERWKFFARAGRMGYNVMSIDGDTMFFRDPYAHIKKKPMSDIQMWCNPEGGGPLHCNGGFMYIQNLRPDGPIAWVFKLVVDDQMWMMDDGYAFVNKEGGQGGRCHSYDQELIFDGVKSAFVGRPIPYDFVVGCKPDTWTITDRNANVIGKEQILNNLRFFTAHDRDRFGNATQVIPPSDWAPAGMDMPNEYTHQWVNRLTVPNLAYGWPAELGGRLGPEKRGPYTEAWIAQLKSDCPDCPWWNEYRPLKNGRDELDVALGPNLDGVGGEWVNELFWDDDVPVELIGVGPAWLANSIGGYRNGMWAGPGELGIGHTTAIVHVHHWPEITSWHKTVVRKIVGRYNWELGSQTSANNTPYTSGYPVTRVLALHPSIDLGRTRTLAEYNRIVLGLIQVAHLTHRTVVFPDVPCEAPWLHQGQGRDNTCKMPVNFPDGRWPLIWSMPYAIDPDTRQLVGGWVRRLLWAGARRLLGLSPSTASTATGDATTGTRYIVDSATGRPVLHAPSSDDVTVAGGDRNTEARRRPWLTDLKRRLLGGPVRAPQPDLRRRLLDDGSALYRTAEQRREFWKDKRFMYSISGNADFQCTREIGNPGGIMMHELAHWMTTPAAHNASWTPDETNVVLPLAEGEAGENLRLVPQALNTPHGQIHRNFHEPRWSVADQQVLLPIGQTVREMSRFANVPLVYLGHPVALISSEERHKRGDTVDHGRPLATASTHTSDQQAQQDHTLDTTTMASIQQPQQWQVQDQQPQQRLQLEDQHLQQVELENQQQLKQAQLESQRRPPRLRRQLASQRAAGAMTGRLQGRSAQDGGLSALEQTLEQQGSLGQALGGHTLEEQEQAGRRLASYDAADWDGARGKLIGDRNWLRAGNPVSLDALNSMLKEVMDRFTGASCKAAWSEKLDGKPPSFLDPTFPDTQLGIVHDHAIRLWNPAKKTARQAT